MLNTSHFAQFWKTRIITTSLTVVISSYRSLQVVILPDTKIWGLTNWETFKDMKIAYLLECNSGNFGQHLVQLILMHLSHQS